jgi:phage gp29-like protein
MAKKSKKTENAKPESAVMYSHQAEQALISYLTKMPDGDEVLRKAGVTRHRLSVMTYDDEIYQALEKRQDRLESAPWRIDPIDRPESKILEDHLREWWSEIILGAQNARWYGYSVLEAKWSENLLHINDGVVTGFKGFEWIGEKPMQWYEPKNDGRLILLRAYSSENQDIEVNQQYKHFLTRCKATYANPFGQALLSRLYWVWFFKNSGFKFWAKFVEKFGLPMLIGKTVGKTTDMRDALLQAHASSVLAINNQDTVEIQSANSSGNSSATFETFDKNLERRIQKVILGQTLTSGTDGSGSRALGGVHLEVQNDKFKADVRMILPTVQTIVNALCDVNGWERHRIIIGEEKSLEADKAERDVKLKNAGANLSNQYFEREYGLQEGDLTDQPSIVPNTQFTALPNQAFKFKASSKQLSTSQQEVEELTDAQDLELLNQDQIKDLVAKSDSPESLAFNLMQLIPGASETQFKANLDQALYAGDVLGYVTAHKGG